MPFQPSTTDVHVDRPLTNVAIAYYQSPNAYVARKVFPVVPVAKQSDKYFVFDKGSFLRNEVRKRAPATETAGSGWAVSPTSYYADCYGLHKDVPDEVRANADEPIDMDKVTTRWLTGQMLQNEDIQWAADFFTTGKWATDVTPAALWSDYASSDPISDVDTGRTAVKKVTGFTPNTLVLGWQVFSKLKNHPDVVDRIKYTNSGVVTPQILASLFEVERVVVCESVKATNVEGETAAYDFVHGKHALLCFVSPTPSIEIPSAGYTFVWRNSKLAAGGDMTIRTMRLDKSMADRIEAVGYWDQKLTASDLGYFFNGAVA